MFLMSCASKDIVIFIFKIKKEFKNNKWNMYFWAEMSLLQKSRDIM